MIAWVLQGLFHRPVFLLHFAPYGIQCYGTPLHRQPIGCRPGLGDRHPQDKIGKNSNTGEQPQQEHNNTHQGQIQAKIGGQARRNPTDHPATRVPEQTFGYIS